MKNAKSSEYPQLSFFLPNLCGGGAEKVLTSLAGELAKRGIAVDFVLVNAIGVNLKNLPREVNVVDLHAPNTFLSLLPLIRYFKRQRPDVVISALDLTNLIAIMAQRLSGLDARLYLRIENTVSMQKRVFWKKILEKRLLSIFYPQADGLIAVSRNVADDIVAYAGVPPELVRTIYNPVVTPGVLEKSRYPLSHRWLKNGKQPVILGMGRLNEQKDFSNLLRAFAILRGTIEAKLMILGEGEERAMLEKLAKELGVEDDVEMPGYIENPYPYMRQADVFVLSSKWEGLPTVLIEALACGAAVVSTDCPSGPAEILGGGKYGHLVPVGDVVALAEAILRSLRGDHRKPPVEWLDQFRVEPVVEQYLDILNRRHPE